MADLLEPSETLRDPRELLLSYLDYLRETALRKLHGLDEADLRTSQLPSGWTPLELLQHLAYMERRWVEWGFAGVAVPDPWGDDDPARGRWAVGLDESADDLISRLRAVGRRTRYLVGGADLGELARPGGRFGPDIERPTLQWILLHLLQEYARHVGQLDIVRELTDGAVGE